MKKNSVAHNLAVGILVSGLLCGLASPADAETADPWEGFNRKVFAFNDFFDRWLLKPVAKGYRRVVPIPVRRGIGNIFNNIDTPATAINQFLQGKPGAGFSDSGRFLVNSTIGVVGFFDVASRMGFPKHEEDFGQTFGRWGASSGNPVVLPFWGASTVRDTFGLVLDTAINPVRFINPAEARYATTALRAINVRVNLLAAESLMNTSGDAYLFQRDAVLQRREYLVRDGESEEEDPFLSEEWEE